MLTGRDFEWLLMKLIRILALASLALFASASVWGQNAKTASFAVVDLSSKVGRAASQLRIRALGQDFLLNLEPNSALLASMPARQRQKVAKTDLFLRGTLEGIPSSWVRLNRIGGRFSGGFFDGNELYLIDAADPFLDGIASGAVPGQTVVFRFADLQLDAFIDHDAIQPADNVTTSGTDYLTFSRHLREVAALKGGPMMALPVTIVSDEQFSQVHGNDTESVVIGRINFIDGIFSSQLGVGLQLLHHEILTDNGVLDATDSGDLLGGRVENGSLAQPGFRQFMISGAGSDLPFAGVAHLFTGRDLDGNTIGRAYIGVLCSTGFGYGINQNLGSDTRSALVFAHELGHNFNAPHDGENACESEEFRGIMNGRIRGSEQFSDCSLDVMGQELARASCLVEVFENPDVFRDGFETEQ